MAEFPDHDTCELVVERELHFFTDGVWAVEVDVIDEIYRGGWRVFALDLLVGEGFPRADMSSIEW